MEENEKETDLLRFLQEREAKRKTNASLKQQDQPVQKKNKMKYVNVALVIIVIAGLLIWMNWASIVPEEVEREIVYPANVVLASFYDGDNTFDGGYLWPGMEVEIQPGYVCVSFEVPISDEVMYVTHSIDVRWSPQGVNTYVQLTEV